MSVPPDTVYTSFPQAIDSRILARDASPKTASPGEQQAMTTVQVAPSGRLMREPRLCATDDEVIVPKQKGARPATDKKSWEYITKSGIAGGLAGCAVCCKKQS